MQAKTRERLVKDLPPILGFWLPAVLFSLYSFRFAINVPIFDDYPALLLFMDWFLAADTAREKLSFLFQQTNEHRLVFDRVVVLAQYYLTGRVDFAGLTQLGNGLLVVFVLLLAGRFRKMGFARVQLLPVSFLLFAMTHYANMFFATPSLQFYGSLVFTLLCLIALAGGRIFWAAGLYLINLFTTGGGLVLLPVGVAFLVVRKRWRDLIVFGVCGFLATGLFLYGYDFPAGRAGLQVTLPQIDGMFRTGFAFLGSAFLVREPALILGCCMALLLGFFCLRHPEESLLWLLSVWVLGIAGLVALTRSGLGVDQALTSRYTVYSLVALVCLYGWFSKLTLASPRRRAVLAAGLIFSGVYFFAILGSLEFNDGLRWISDRKIAGMASLAASGNPKNLITLAPGRDRRILIEARRLGVYDFKAQGFDLRRPVQTAEALPAPDSSFRGEVQVGDGLYIHGSAAMPEADASDSRIYLLLKDRDGVIRQVEAFRGQRPEMDALYLQDLLPDDPVFELYLSAYEIPAGFHRLGVMVVNDHRTAIHWQTEPILIP